jgi:splicing factor 3B subunit 2
MAAPRRLTKNEKRRTKRKEQVEPAKNGSAAPLTGWNSNDASNNDDEFDGIEIEYVSADYDNGTNVDASVLEQFRSVFEKFARAEELMSDAPQTVPGSAETKLVVNDATTPSGEGKENAELQKLSKKKKKLLNRLSVAELKQLVPRPDVVEAHDVASTDPRLLVTLKSYRNSVPVPRHWCHIRKYLTGKVGMEKPPFQLPEFIAETGIAKIRDAVMEQEAAKKSKAKARERIRPKMGKIDIDYQVLHDAFFKYQTKPKLTGHGDLYYEGKEYEVRKCVPFVWRYGKRTLPFSCTSTGGGVLSGAVE